MNHTTASETIKQRVDSLTREFTALNDWQDRYQKIIEKGKALPSLPDELKTEEAKVKGCQSQVWLHAHLDPNNRVIFRADSDALIVRGLLALLLSVYSESTPEEILKTPPHFFQHLGFQNHLSPSRANGLQAMVKQIQYFAMAFDTMIKMKRL